MDKMFEHTVNIEELEKSATYLLESLADILSAAGPQFASAHDDLVRLIKSSRLMEPDFVKRSAYSLANAAADVSSRNSRNVLEVKQETPSERMEVREDDPAPTADMKVDGQLSNVFINMINHVVSIRPNNYKVEVEALVRLLKSGAGLEEILQRFLDLVVQIREDLWEERSKAFKHVGEILKSLEKTEKDFIGSLSSSQTYISGSESSFTTVMEDGLKEIGTLVTPNPSAVDLEQMFKKVSDKVNKLCDCIQQKKDADKDRLEALASERTKAEKRLAQTHQDYATFSRQSHEMMQEIENLKAASFHDPLTNVLNRRAYDDQISKTLLEFKNKALRTCSMIVFDIDHFRDFNNTYGHLAGDRVLSYVAKLTKESLRNDDLIYRYGGDEFVILMPNAGLAAAIGVAEKIRRNIDSVEFKLSKTNTTTVQVTLSMGVAEIKTEDNGETFFARADQAMYQAKTAGRNRVSSCS
ncbi:hypothetical protein C4J81_02610 [Deltaproteobacteria bacterium Smac51]|nr:hypothetical protein C4J81_02610 [Deltaproteobacteria bacterium Smac51]